MTAASSPKPVPCPNKSYWVGQGKRRHSGGHRSFSCAHPGGAGHAGPCMMQPDAAAPKAPAKVYPEPAVYVGTMLQASDLRRLAILRAHVAAGAKVLRPLPTTYRETVAELARAANGEVREAYRHWLTTAPLDCPASLLDFEDRPAVPRGGQR